MPCVLCIGCERANRVNAPVAIHLSHLRVLGLGWERANRVNAHVTIHLSHLHLCLHVSWYTCDLRLASLTYLSVSYVGKVHSKGSSAWAWNAKWQAPQAKFFRCSRYLSLPHVLKGYPKALLWCNVLLYGIQFQDITAFLDYVDRWQLVPNCASCGFCLFFVGQLFWVCHENGSQALVILRYSK